MRRKNARGFSLVEVMVASAILGVGVIAATKMFSSGVDGVSWTKNRSAATNIAIQRLEMLGTMGIDQLPACVGQVGCKAGFNSVAPVLANAGTYACTRMLDDMIGDPDTANATGKYRVDTVVEAHPDVGRQAEARLVTVSVCWTDDTDVHQVQLNRLFIPNVDD